MIFLLKYYKKKNYLPKCYITKNIYQNVISVQKEKYFIELRADKSRDPRLTQNRLKKIKIRDRETANPATLV